MTENGNPGGKVRVGWLLIGDQSVASSRLQGYLIHDWLRQKSHVHSSIIWSPRKKYENDLKIWQFISVIFRIYMYKPNILIYQKVAGKWFKRLMKISKYFHIENIFVDCDLREVYPFSSEIHHFVVPSEALRADIYKKIGRRPILIKDPAEFGVSDPKIRDRDAHLATKGVWVGSRTNWDSIREFITKLRAHAGEDIVIETISDHKDAQIRWRIEDFPSILFQYNFAVIPVTCNRASYVKSSNRAVMYMAAGLPVLAQDCPMYRDIIQHGVNGFLFNNTREFVDSVRHISDNNVYEAIVLAGYATVRDRFSIDRIGQEWHTLLCKLQEENQIRVRKYSLHNSIKSKCGVGEGKFKG